MKQLRFKLLDNIHIYTESGGSLAFRDNKVRALLIYLVLNADQPIQRSHLSVLLWPEFSNGGARSALRKTLYRLRGTLVDAELPQLAERLVATRNTLMLESSTDLLWVDVLAQEKLLSHCLNHNHDKNNIPPDCLDRLQQAADLYQQPLLMGFSLPDAPAFNEWASVKREELQQRELDILTLLTTHYGRQQAWRMAQRMAQRQIDLEPWREMAHQQMMHVFVAMGDRAAALTQYKRCAEILQKELNVQPSVETRRLVEAIRRDRSSVALPTDSIPTLMTPLIGRKTELANLSDSLRSEAYRVITLIGPGGVGKTDLAIEAARQNRSHFTDDVCFVSVSDLQTPDQVAAAILTTLDSALAGGQEQPQAVLLRQLRARHLLLVLDGLENVTEQVDLLLTILENAPQIILLITAQEELPLQSADLFSIRGLAYPRSADDPQARESAAVRLFVTHAQRVDKLFTLHDSLLPYIVKICTLLEGDPLAISLAASIVRHFSCREIVEMIADDLSILSTTAHDVSPHHRSLQAVFDRAWYALSKSEQRYLARLTTIQGRFNLCIAKQVTSQSPVLLKQLMRKSLVRGHGGGEYDLHFITAHFARMELEKIGFDERWEAERPAMNIVPVPFGSQVYKLPI